MPSQLTNIRLHAGNVTAGADIASELPRRDAALYIAEMILELRNVAKAARLKSVQGYLELTYYEAYSEANKVAVPPGEEEHLQTIGEDARRAMVESQT